MIHPKAKRDAHNPETMCAHQDMLYMYGNKVIYACGLLLLREPHRLPQKASQV